MIAILGARGVGKITMLIQHIKQYDDSNTSLFVTVDDIEYGHQNVIPLWQFGLTY